MQHLVVTPDVPICRLEVHFQIGIRQPVTYSRYQFPLTLSWKTTVHAVQGLTLDRIVIDMKKITSRQPGYVYVAMSHCKTLDGLHIMSFTKTAIKADQHHHLRQFHVVNYSFTGTFYSASSTETEDVDADADFDNDLLVIHSKSDRRRVENLQQEATSMVAALCANSSIPYSGAPEIVQSVDNMTGTTVDYFQSETINLLRDCKVSEEILATVDSSSKQQCYKQDQFFNNHPLAVKPETVILRQRFDKRIGVTRSVYDSSQYVSVESTLRSLLQNAEYVKLLVTDKCAPGFITDCWDGLLYQHYPLLSDTSKFTLAIQLFYDRMGTTNPLRGQSSTCNVGVFYFIVNNLLNVFNSCLANVHLVSLCHAQDLKTYCFKAVLSKFLSMKWSG